MRLRVIIILTFISAQAVSQQSPYFRQFYFNPFLFNPAFAGVHDYTQASVMYRKQWVGFSNAPSVAGFTIEIPTQNRMSFGFSATAQETVALQQGALQSTVAYRLPLSKNQFLFFGLSGVLHTNYLNPNGDYANDPAILGATNNTFYADINFGLVYAIGNLKLGFALPKMIGQKYYSPIDLANIRYAQFRNQLYSISYRFNFGSIAWQPYALYRLNKDAQDWWEAASVFYYKNKLWVGASYHQQLGAGAFVGFDIKEKLTISYGYELPPVNKEFINTSSHEIQLKLRLGNKKLFKWAARFENKNTVQTAVSQQIIKPETEAQKKEAANVVAQSPLVPEIKEPTVDIISETNDDTPLKTETNNPNVTPIEKPLFNTKPGVSSGEQLLPGFYLIAGSFNSKTNADVLKKRLLSYGFADTQVGKYGQNNLYYVYIFASESLAECQLERIRARQNAITAQAWILTVKQ